MTYYAVRSREDPELFVTENGFDSFLRATLHRFETRATFEHFVAHLPPQVELVEVTFQAITGKALN